MDDRRVTDFDRHSASVESNGGLDAGVLAPDALLLLVTNPVDVLTHVALEASGLPSHRVIGTGTMLDTARLRQVIGCELNIEPRSIHAQVVGEHGDSEVFLWSGAHIGGLALRDWSGWDVSRETRIEGVVRNAAATMDVVVELDQLPEAESFVAILHGLAGVAAL